MNRPLSLPVHVLCFRFERFEIVGSQFLCLAFIQSKFVSLCFFCQFCIMQLSGSAGEIRSRRNRDPPKPYSENSERIQPFLLLRFAIVSLTQKDRTFSENSLTRMFVPEAVLSNPSACLPRKEVIQPHLPIRLPCYDFTPVIGFAFDAWLPCGLPQRLRAPPTPMV